MPETIELLVSVGGVNVGLIPIEIPGEKVKALTSTYSIA